MASRCKPFDKTFFLNFRFAFRGLWLLFRDERNARFHLAVACAVVLAGFLLGLTAGEWAAVTIAVALVIAAEALNSAVERLCDHITTDRHPLIGEAKDLAAAAVLVTALGAVAVGLIIFLPRLWALFA